MASSQLADRLASGGFALTAEVVPPRSGEPAAVLARAEALRGKVDAVNLTDGAGAQTAMASLPAAAILARGGIEPVLQMTCRDRNRIALAGDLLGAGALGIRNLLLLTGDDPSQGDQPEAKPVFDLGSAELLALAAGIRDHGRLPSGRQVDDPPDFLIGAADLPIDPAPDWRPDGLRAKVDAGARFVQTQLCFDIGVIRRYVGRLRDEGLTEGLGILIGLGPLASARSARWMRDNLFGVLLPDELIARLEGAADARAEGIRICGELLAQLAEVPGVAGAHLMAPVNPADIPAAIAAAGPLPGRAAKG
ncbi:MAG: methylenetetrahydrofolate reductase [Alphaproteobacteria bacterium]|jgi:methylenetetrahydrofolate reductase (NADPH)|nr:methylenetetrahydrofolate reductase [Alphaproteobacteria bacterium]MDP6563648.1 methylenetetrahydrofolate reductase [Alphaproteobacteria bacterium]MDP6815834.1 methylenetetrahydrofolate reductase [Alphaproteobacteria bacterium]